MTDGLKQRLRVFAGDPILGGVIDEAADRIEQLESERDELMACLNLIYSWAYNWDSEFMNDPDWQDEDYPRIQAALAKVRKPT